MGRRSSEGKVLILDLILDGEIELPFEDRATGQLQNREEQVRA